MIARAAARLFRVLVAVGLTAYLLWRSDPKAVLAAAAGADLSWIGAAIGLVLVDRTLMAQRWMALLCIVDAHSRPPFRRLLEIFLVSTFVGTFLPASVGGDAVRAYSVSRASVAPADAVASVFMDRMLGVASLLIMSLAGLFLAHDLVNSPFVVASLAVTAVACAITVAIVFSSRVGLLLTSKGPRRFAGAFSSVMASVQRYAPHHRQLLRVLASSVGVQVLRILQAYCLGRALGIGADLPVFFAFIPLILIVMLLPITINGLGTSQALFIWFFGRAGVDAPRAFALSALFLALGVVGNLPGSLFYAMRGFSSDSK